MKNKDLGNLFLCVMFLGIGITLTVISFRADALIPMFIGVCCAVFAAGAGWNEIKILRKQ